MKVRILYALDGKVTAHEFEGDSMCDLSAERKRLESRAKNEGQQFGYITWEVVKG